MKLLVFVQLPLQESLIIHFQSEGLLCKSDFNKCKTGQFDFMQLNLFDNVTAFPHIVANNLKWLLISNCIYNVLLLSSL